MEIPKDIVTIILAKLPLRSVARFRSLSKEWKSCLDSDFFRDQYMSLNNSSSVSWSIANTEHRKLSLEIVGHHGCERWGLTRSLGHLMRFNTAGTTIRRILLLTCTDGLVSIYTEASDGTPRYYIGNPLLEQWSQIRVPDSMNDCKHFRYDGRFSEAGLVTKMEKGIVVSYKVVWMVSLADFSDNIHLFIYSSETGRWSTKTLCCPRSMTWSRLENPIPLNGILHWLSADNQSLDANSIVAYDLYKDDENLDPNSIVAYALYEAGDDDESLDPNSIVGYEFHIPRDDEEYNDDEDDDDEDDDDDVDDLDDCIVLCFPDAEQDDNERRFRRTFTTSEGSLVYFNEYIDNKGGRTLKVWKLANYCTDDPTVWHLSWQINLAPLFKFDVDYFPVVMHPLNCEEIYLWSRNMNGMMVLNLRTQRFNVHRESSGNGSKCMDGCIMSFNCCKEYMDRVFASFLTSSQEDSHDVYFSQYVLPKWMSSLPSRRPPPSSPLPYWADV